MDLKQLFEIALVKPNILYHVVSNSWIKGQPLKSLYARYQNKAYAIFNRKWQYGKELSNYHAHLIMFYTDLKDALEHAGNSKRILVINPDEVELYFDTLEKPGFWATHYDVPYSAIEKIIYPKKNITEAPINDLEFIDAQQDFQRQNDKGSFRQNDWKVHNNEKWIKKVNNLFSKCPYNFNLYFTNTAHTYRSLQHKMGEISKEDFLSYISTREQRRTELPSDYKNSINIVFTNNEGGERVGLTPWIVAHRAVHAMITTDNESVINLLRAFDNFSYRHNLRTGSKDEIDKKIAKLSSNFKSARDGSIIRLGEYFVDLFTSYIVFGKIVLNKPQLSEETQEIMKSPYFNVWNSNPRLEQFIKECLRMNGFKNEPPPPIYNSYIAYNSEGNPVSQFDGSDDKYFNDKVKYHEEKGRTIKKYEPTTREINRYNNFIKLKNDFKELFYKISELVYTNDYSKHEITRSDEQTLEEAMNNVLQSAKGRFYVL